MMLLCRDGGFEVGIFGMLGLQKAELVGGCPKGTGNVNI